MRAVRLIALVALLEFIALIVVIASKGAQRHPRKPTSTQVAKASKHHSSRADAYPAIDAMSAASTYLESRQGTNAFAVVNSEGQEFGLNEHHLFLSASTVKSMLLVAYLRQLAAKGEDDVDGQAASLLEPMIEISDNYDAEAVFDIVGTAGLEQVAHLAGMTDFKAGIDWANELISCADMARFFYRMQSLIPRQFRGYASNLLSHVAKYESWGIPQVARPAWTVYFKGGWRGTPEGQLVSQIARLQQPGRTIAIAVMTVTDPTMGYGEETIEGVTAKLLGVSS
jgi:hypothetical protein